MNLLVELGKIDAETFKTVAIVAGLFAGIAIILVIAILLVGKFFKVDVDEKVTKILENLAGANCGGCGCSGCSGFAQKLCQGTATLSACQVTSPESKAEIAKILGVELKSEERTVAVVKCNGGENAALKFDYNGDYTCASLASIMDGDRACTFACLGCGDCKAVCPEKAITVEGRLARVNSDRCISCGACVLKCPKHVIEKIPESAPVYCACSSECKAKEVTSACKVGCIGCTLCAKKCPNGAITMVNNLPVFDYSKCTGCKVCVSACPRKIIKERL